MSRDPRAARVATCQSGEPASSKGEPPNACCTCRRAFIQRNFTVGTETSSKAAARLPDDLRVVFDLLWYQGMAQAEAAALLGIAVATVKLRWMKARLQVQQALGGSPFDEPGSPD